MTSLTEIERNLRELLISELAEIPRLLTTTEYQVTIPEAVAADMDIAELRRLVARSSNLFGRLSLLGARARGAMKLAKGSYERVYKRSKVGGNEDARDAAAMDAAKELHAELAAVECLVEVVESYEAAARIASESARKLLDKASNGLMASQRESHGYYDDADFRSF